MQRKRFTAEQVRLQKILEDMGIEVVPEYPVGGYFIDLYSPEYRVAFEYDGPGHFRKRDAIRDAFLQANYGIETFRTSDFDDIEIRIKEFLEGACEKKA